MKYKFNNILALSCAVIIILTCCGSVNATEPLTNNSSLSTINQTVIPNYTNVSIQTANHDGIAYNIFGNNTYFINFEGVDRGLNAIHISTDFMSCYGQITTTSNQSGVFYVTDTGGKQYEDDIIIMLAVNGTIPDNFTLHILSSGYNWTPNVIPNTAPDPATITYQDVGINETFTKDDFIYGPQIWKPTGNVNYPIYNGQNMDDINNIFQIMFIDLKVGVMGSIFTSLINQGAAKIEYSFTNLNSAAVFNVYGYCNQSNNANNSICWSNRVLTTNSTGNYPSGYTVLGLPKTVAEFSSDISSGSYPLSVNFKDQSKGNMTSWAWDFDNDGVVDSSQQNPTYIYKIPGNYSVKLVVNGVAGIDEEIKSNYITVDAGDTIAPLIMVDPKGVFLSKVPINVNISSESDAKIYYRINNGSWNNCTGSGTVSLINDGINLLECYAVDVAGNPSLHETYSYTIDKIKPTATASLPSGLYNNIRTVNLNAVDNMDPNPEIYYSLDKGLTWKNRSKTATLNISSGNTVLMFYAVDAAGNSCPIQTLNYAIDKTNPKVTSSYPKNSATGFSRTRTIYIKFTENIKTSINWSKVVVKNRYGHIVSISKWVSGNTIYIKTSNKRSSYSYYTVYVPAGAIKDYAGNNLAAGFTFKFKTGRY